MTRTYIRAIKGTLEHIMMIHLCGSICSRCEILEERDPGSFHSSHGFRASSRCGQRTFQTRTAIVEAAHFVVVVVVVVDFFLNLMSALLNLIQQLLTQDFRMSTRQDLGQHGFRRCRRRISGGGGGGLVVGTTAEIDHALISSLRSRSKQSALLKLYEELLRDVVTLEAIRNSLSPSSNTFLVLSRRTCLVRVFRTSRLTAHQQ